ncbi:uncharacterized protein ACN427_014399 [Glossina fuscipes fuscipes]
MLSNTNSIKLIIRANQKCAPVLRKIQIWGLPARSLDTVDRELVKSIWNEITNPYDPLERQRIAEEVGQRSPSRCVPELNKESTLQIPEEFLDAITWELMVYAVVVSHEQISGELSPATVSYTSGFFQIPVIGISLRDAASSDKNIHVFFLRTVTPYYHQGDVWLEITLVKQTSSLPIVRTPPALTNFLLLLLRLVAFFIPSTLTFLSYLLLTNLTSIISL